MYRESFKITKMIIIALSPKIKDVELFIDFLKDHHIHAFIGCHDYNTINGEKVISNSDRKLINDLYNDCF